MVVRTCFSPVLRSTSRLLIPATCRLQVRHDIESDNLMAMVTALLLLPLSGVAIVLLSLVLYFCSSHHSNINYLGALAVTNLKHLILVFIGA